MMVLDWLDVLPDAAIVVDAAGMIVAVNEQATIMFGYPRVALLRMSVEALVPDTQRSLHAAHRATYIAHSTPRRMAAGQNLMALRADGELIPVDISLARITVEWYIAVARDANARDADIRYRALTDQLLDAQRKTIAAYAVIHRLTHDDDATG